MRTYLLIILLLFSCSRSSQAQESGPMMMQVQVGFTLAGFFGGAALGGIVWLTDPAGPVGIVENLKNGMILGSFVGAIFGAYVLYNAAIVPETDIPSPSDGGEEGDYESSHPTPYSLPHSPQIALNLIRYRF